MKHLFILMCLAAIFAGCGPEESQPTGADNQVNSGKDTDNTLSRTPDTEPRAVAPATLALTESLLDYPNSRLRDDMEDIIKTEGGVTSSMVARLSDDSPSKVSDYYEPLRDWTDVQKMGSTTTFIAENDRIVESITISEENGVTIILITRTITAADSSADG